MILKRVEPLSLGKVLAVLYAVIGGIVGVIMALVGMVALAFGPGEGAAMAVFMGIIWIIFFPVVYGVLGGLGGLLVAFLYNWVAQYIGGLELTLE